MEKMGKLFCNFCTNLNNAITISHFAVFKLLLISTLLQRATSNDDREPSPCTVCRDGSLIPPDFANVSMVIPGFEFVRNCGILQNMLSTLDSTIPTCTNIQPFGTICGCTIPENACTLCPDGNSVPEEYYTTTLESYENPLFPPGITPHCRLLQAYMHSTTIENETCSEGRQLAANCGCSGTEDLSAPTSPPNPTTNTSIPTTNTTTSEPTTDSSELCTFCRDGGEFAYPEKNVTPFLVRNWELLSEGIPNFLNPNSLGTITCQNLAGLLDSALPLKKNTEQCNQVQMALGGICGCQALDRYCYFCPNDEYIPQPDKLLQYTSLFRNGGARVPALTCSEARSALTQVHYINSNQCFLINYVQHTCGCNGGERYYLGADSEVKKAFLAWIPRFTGLVSLMGSMWIITDILRNSENRNLMFSQIMLGMSTFDSFSSMSWIFSTAAIPKHDFGEPTGVYGAIGNEATCKAQGFFLQLGLIGSISYNIVLSIYYVLVIVKCYREFQFQRLRRWFLVVPIILACTYAIAGISHYNQIFLSCHVLPYPVYPDHARTLGFALIPLATAWLFCSLCMFWIYWVVRKQNKAARKWRFPTAGTDAVTRKGRTSENVSQQGNIDENNNTLDASNNCFDCRWIRRWFRRSNVESDGTNANARGNGRASIDRAVAWQASFYLCSFLLTWPFYFISFLDMTIPSYGFWVMVVIFTPLQGFFNWIVYMRPRWGQKINQRNRNVS